MDAKENLYNFQMERLKIFKAQDYDSGEFDVVFEIGGKKLYADKYVLSPISTTFKAMLSKRWITMEPIKITECTFEDFMEFFTFLYSGECQLTNDNISVMIDLAEFYDISILKKICDQFMSKIEIGYNNIFQLLEISEKYNLQALKEPTKLFLANNFVKCLESDSFLHQSRLKVMELVKTYESTVFNEEIFNAVCFSFGTIKGVLYFLDKYINGEIIKYQRIKLEQFLQIFMLKDEISKILSTNHFLSMKMDFLINTVFKSCLFSGTEISEILSQRRRNIYVTVINASGKKAEGYLQCDDAEKEKIFDAIKSLKDQYCRGYSTTYWSTPTLSTPSTPSLLKKKDFIKYYLVLDRNADLAIRYSLYDTDYLIAEIKGLDEGFYCSHNCKIEVHRDY